MADRPPDRFTAIYNYYLLQNMLKRRHLGTPEGMNAEAPSQWQGGRLPEPGEIEEAIRQGGDVPPDKQLDDHTYTDLLQAIKEKTPYDI
jgi:hypothetical protein